MAKSKLSLAIVVCLSILLFGVASFMSWKINDQSHESSADRLNSESEFNSVDALLAFFQTNNYQWPLNQFSEIPDLRIDEIPADIKALPPKQKKTLFLRILLPVVLHEKKQVREKRTLIEEVFRNSNTTLSAESSPWFANLLREYRVNQDLDFETQKQQILKKVDDLPVTFILAQAAIESGWGTSRFALEGNSLFGEWTFEKDKGLVPNQRQEGKSHQVKAFASIADSVRSYIRNINRNRAYRELREIRAAMRAQNQKLDAVKLAEGLHRYSQKGVDYVIAVQKLLNSPEFKLIESLNFQPEPAAAST